MANTQKQTETLKMNEDKKMKSTALIIAVFTSILLSCITTTTNQEMRLTDFAVTIPAEWTKIDTVNWDLMLTREGPHKQLISVNKRPLSAPYKYSQLVIDEKMAPGQIADIIIRELNSDPHLTKLQILEVMGEKISGQDGFRIVFSCIHEGFIFKTVHCGFVSGKYLYSLRFITTYESIYERDLPAFEKLLKSFKLL
jgi:hypothetical protein